MTLDLLVRYLHFIGIFVWIGALTTEWLLLAEQVPRQQIRRLLRIDRAYGAAAIVVVVTGLLQWLVVGKPAEFYTANGIFHTKVTLAIVVGLLSIYPSIFLSRESKKDDAAAFVSVPRRIRQLVLGQVFLMVLIPLLAVLMAAGVGLG
ncbi:MAG: DUF2214 family protein [Bacteroidota bacterium]